LHQQFDGKALGVGGCVDPGEGQDVLFYWKPLGGKGSDALEQLWEFQLEKTTDP